MRKFQWLLAFPLVLAASIGPTHASSIIDNAGLFDPDVVRQAEAKLNRIERDSKIATTIETIDSLKGEPLGEVTRRHAERSGTEGIYILIPKEEHKFEILVSRPFRNALSVTRQTEIRNAFVEEFKKRDFNAGLRRGVDAIETAVNQAKAERGGVLAQAAPRTVPIGGPVRARPAARGSFGLGSLLMIVLGILAVLFVFRLLGSLLGGGARGGYPGPGPRPMGGPGYGGPGYGGYGGGGGGFWSSMFGGIGGAMAGNWLYDQFSGRHQGGNVDNASYGGTEAGPPAETGGSDWSGGGVTGDWGGGGGGDAGGGGDWGGGGGGGDWGGGGGDSGGGGGDW